MSRCREGKRFRSPVVVTTFQDGLFETARRVQRTLQNGTVLRLKLEPLPGERVRVSEYHRKVPGTKWQRLREEEGRVVRYEQLKLTSSFAEVFTTFGNE